MESSNIKLLELLAPAKDLVCGVAAINSGADAVYIGAPKFGARQAAGNSIENITKLAEYAHRFRAKVYVAFNTIILNNELAEAEKMIHDLYSAGVDALIIQDLGILEMNLPPLPLFASTQMHNHSPEQVKFLEKVGFKRAILARELSLDQIREIHSASQIELESFVFGSICVSYSGRCYLSEYLAERSSNRGTCIQACRLPYKLVGGNNVISEGKYLLSPKDLNLSKRLPDLISAGVTSFKIEGRLKDLDYVINSVYYFRKLLDEIISSRADLGRSSLGVTEASFTPDLSKTFNRGFTEYNIDGKRDRWLADISPKSIGKKIGRAKAAGPGWFQLDSKVKLNSGDGLCFVGGDGTLIGANVNRLIDEMIFLSSPVFINKGAEIYRNFDKKFVEDILAHQPQRRLGLKFIFSESDSGFLLEALDEEGNKGETKLEIEKVPARNIEAASANIRNQLEKLKDTFYFLSDLEINWSQAYFIPLSIINEARRQLISTLDKQRLLSYQRQEVNLVPNDYKFFEKDLNREYNVSNSLAEKFYHRHGVSSIEPALEINHDCCRQPQKLMTTKHCLRSEFGRCLKKSKSERQDKGDWYLENERGQKLKLRFDCNNCQMEVWNDKS